MKALNPRSIRPLDAAIVGVAIAVLVLAGVLGWNIWSQNREVEEATPVGRAVAELQGMIRDNPDDLNLRMELAQALTTMGRDEEATEQYSQVLNRSENHIAAIMGLGFVTARQQEWAKSEEYWKRAIDLIGAQPDGKRSEQWSRAHFYLGNALLEQKRNEEAIGAFKESLRVDRTASDTYYLLAVAFRNLEAQDEYRSNLELALAFDPTLAQANYDLGMILLEEEDLAAAAQHFRIAVDNAPGRPEPADELERLGPASDRIAEAEALSETDPDEALVQVRIAVAVEPDNTEALLLLGTLYEKTGDKEAAKETYRSVVAAEPENTEAAAALKRVTDGK